MQKEKILNDVPGFEGKDIVIKKLNYGEKSRLAGATTKVRIISGKESSEVDVEAMRLYTLLLGIKSAPFFAMADKNHKINAINCLEEETGMFLYEKINEINKKQIKEEVLEK